MVHKIRVRVIKVTDGNASVDMGTRASRLRKATNAKKDPVKIDKCPFLKYVAVVNVGARPCALHSVPTAMPVPVFHRLVIAHAGRTKQNPPAVYETAGGNRPATDSVILLLHFSAGC